MGSSGALPLEEVHLAAYLIVDVEVTDAAAFEEYRQKVPAVDAQFGGTYLVRGGACRVLEGDWDPHRMVVIAFPDMATLNAWYDSPEYAPLKALRKRCTRSRLIAVEGA